MKKMKLVKGITLLAFLSLGMTSFAQEGEEVITGDAVKVEKSRGEDPNILSEEGNTTNYEGKVVKSLEKGSNTRGGLCYVYIDNYTSWTVKCYVDGYYEGTVGRYGSGYVTVGSGNTKVYNVAEFNDGSNVTWGPTTQYCGNGYQFDMTIYEDYYRANVH